VTSESIDLVFHTQPYASSSKHNPHSWKQEEGAAGKSKNYSSLRLPLTVTTVETKIEKSTYYVSQCIWVKSPSLPIATTHPYFSFSFSRYKEEEVLLAGMDPVASTLLCCPTYEQLVLPDQEQVLHCSVFCFQVWCVEISHVSSSGAVRINTCKTTATCQFRSNNTTIS